MDDELAQMKAAVEPAISDIDQAEGLQDLRRRRRPGNGPGEVHRAVHDHSAIRHSILPVAPALYPPEKAPFYRDFGD